MTMLIHATLEDLKTEGIYPLDYYIERSTKNAKFYNRGLITAKEFRSRARELTSLLMEYKGDL